MTNIHEKTEAEIQALEEQLRLAILSSDTAVLDQLLASDLIFTNHLGQIMTKQDDLMVHQSGRLKIENIQLFDRQIRVLDPVAIVTVKARILAYFNGERTENEIRFTRVWCRNLNHQWHITVAHASEVK